MDNKDMVFITLKEACELTGIGRNTMLKLTKLEGFPAIRFSRKTLIYKEDFCNWIKCNYGKINV